MVKFTSVAFVATIFSALASAAPLDRRHADELAPRAAPVIVHKIVYVPAPNYKTKPRPAKADWRAEMLKQVNDVRAKVRKPALVLDSHLNKLAQDHSDYQYRIKKMTHDDAGGALGARTSKTGLQWRSLAENVAWNQKDVSDVVKAWVKSPGHYANMVGDYTKAGFGESHLYWTQNFAK